jgi:hypothetical protein
MQRHWFKREARRLELELGGQGFARPYKHHTEALHGLHKPPTESQSVSNRQNRVIKSRDSIKQYLGGMITVRTRIAWHADAAIYQLGGLVAPGVYRAVHAYGNACTSSTTKVRIGWT